MSKGSIPRPVDQQKYNDNFDRIFRSDEVRELFIPVGYMTTPDCGWPFCDCVKVCEKVTDKVNERVENDRNTKL